MGGFCDDDDDVGGRGRGCATDRLLLQLEAAAARPCCLRCVVVDVADGLCCGLDCVDEAVEVFCAMEEEGGGGGGNLSLDGVLFAVSVKPSLEWAAVGGLW